MARSTRHGSFYRDSARRRHASTVRRAREAGTLSNISRQGELANQRVRSRWRPAPRPRRRQTANPRTIAPVREPDATVTRPATMSQSTRRTRPSPVPESIAYEPLPWTDHFDAQMLASYKQFAAEDPRRFTYVPGRPHLISGRRLQRRGDDGMQASPQDDGPQSEYRLGFSEVRELRAPIPRSVPADWIGDDVEDGESLETATPTCSSIRSPTRRLPVGSRRQSPEEQLAPLRDVIDQLERSLSGNQVPEHTDDAW